MAHIFRKLFTKPLPPGAEIVARNGEEVARWKDASGKTRTAPVTAGEGGAKRIVLTARTFTARYRDAGGVVREVATGCKDETAARSRLAELDRRAELVKANVITPAEDAVSDQQTVALAEHLNAFESHLLAKGVTEHHRKNTLKYLHRLADDCGFARLRDLDRSALENWLAERARAGKSSRARNAYRDAAVTFGNWAVASRRLVANPFAGVPSACERTDPRRKRRALTEEDLGRLLQIARERPLKEALTVRRGGRKGQLAAELEPGTRARLEAVGRERALIYKTLVLTGLRKNELASLTAGQIQLDEPVPYAILEAADEKNREGSQIPLRSDLAEDLRLWLADRLEGLRNEAARAGGPIPVRLPANTPLFRVPDGLLRILDRDFAASGIPKRDERGRTVDVHALRTTFGTLLSKHGVPLRTAQAAMRHSDPRLTANVYTDPKLLDVRGAVESLPNLPVDGRAPLDSEALPATGTDGAGLKGRASALAPGLAPAPDFSCRSGSSGGNRDEDQQGACGAADIAVGIAAVKSRERLSLGVSRRRKQGSQESNPEPADLESRRRGYPVDSSDHYMLWSLARRAAATSRDVTGSTLRTCWTSRKKSFPRTRLFLRWNLKVNSSR